MKWNGVIEEYRKFLPVTKKTPVVTLKEGNTPLLESKHIVKLFDEKIRLYFKCEGFNPTGSFKDRGMTMAVSKAKEEGAKKVICASTGNTSASAAAYASRAGLECIVILPARAIAMGKLSQALMHGAKVLAVEGSFDEAFKIVRKIIEKFPITLVNSINPYRIEGQKTSSFEIVDTLGEAPDFQCMPVGNAGNITAYWKGYKEYRDAKKIKKLPRMMGFQAEGAAPIVHGHPIRHPKTIATAIRIGNPASWKTAVQAKHESHGAIDMVSDEEILQAYQDLAKMEGIFVEPASAAALAGALKLYKKGVFAKSAKDKNKIPSVVCILTGHGLKDPGTATQVISPPRGLKPDLKTIMRALKLS